MGSITDQRGRRLVRILTILTIALAGIVSAASAEVPVVAFQVETEAGREAAQECHEVWLKEGPRLTSELLGDASTIAGVDTVLCLVLDTESFQRYFAGSLPDWGVGAALPTGRTIALDYSRIPAVGRGLREIFLHEMVHALLFQGAGGAWLPTWLHEGTAMLYSGEWRFSDTVSLVLDGNVPDLYRLQGRFPIPHERADRAYRTSLLAVTRLRKGYGDKIVGDLVAETKKNGDFPTAFAGVTGQDLADFHQEFATAMRLKFGWMLFLTRWPGLFVLLALVLTVGASRKIVLNRRRMAAMEDLPPDSEWPPGPEAPN